MQVFTHELIAVGAFTLQEGYKNFASTQNDDKFSITIGAANW